MTVGVHVLPGATSGLQFDREALAAGQWWRLVTAHLTHFDANHLAWDVGMLVALGAVCEAISRRGVMIALGLASVAITAAVWAWQPHFETYRGLSGLDCALFGLFATWLIRQPSRQSAWLGIIALLGVGAKSAFEINTGTPMFASGSGYSPVPLAHLVGAISGIAAATLRSLSMGLRASVLSVCGIVKCGLTPSR
jgi:rhomboid family GlyGly-CTERM serine protease